MTKCSFCGKPKPKKVRKGEWWYQGSVIAEEETTSWVSCSDCVSLGIVADANQRRRLETKQMMERFRIAYSPSELQV